MDRTDMPTSGIGKVRSTSISFLLFAAATTSVMFATPRGEIHGIAVSPDGKTMAVAHKKGKNTFIYMIPMATGIASRLTNAKAGKESCPAFSADGKLFAYAYVSDQESQRIIVMSVDGSNPHSLPSTGTANLYPTFSPDEKSIYFARSQPYPADHLWDIFSAGVDGTNVKQLTHEGFVQISQPSISPDGQKLLLATLGLSTSGRMEIYSLNHPQDPSQVLSPTIPRQAKPSPIFANPNFAPDGGSILFLAASMRRVNYDYDVYRLDLNSGVLERITKGIGYATDLRIFADGKTGVLLRWKSDWQGTANRSEFYLIDLQKHKLTRFNVRGLD